MSRVKGNGWFVNEREIIYVQGTINGTFTRKSTKKKATKLNLAWIKKNANSVLLQLTDKEDTLKIQVPTLKEFAYKVLDITAHKRCNYTQTDYISKLEKHILPYFKHFKIDDVKALDIENFQNTLLNKRSSSTVHKCRIILGMVFKKAVANDYITKNPVDYADSIRIVNKKTIPYNEVEVRLMISKAEGWLKMFLVLAFSTGMRSGEIINLRWEDIHIEEGYIDLKRGLNETIVGENKNHKRLVELIPDCIKMLANYHMVCDSKKWLFVSCKGTPYTNSRTIVDSYFKPLLLKNGIEYKTLKATRHTFTSMMLNNGFDKTWVKEMLGHSPESIVTDKFYFEYKRNEERLQSANNFFNFQEERVK